MSRVPTGKGRGQGKAAVMAETEVPMLGWRQWLVWSFSGQLWGCWGYTGLAHPSFSPQSSQPSTTSPFKQEVFVYSPSPSSESPGLGTAATPIIMNRSPTGQWHVKMCMT